MALFLPSSRPAGAAARPPRPPASDLRRRLLALAAATAVSVAESASALASTAHDDFSSMSRQAYQGGAGESVNLYDLNVVMTLPLSPVYPMSDHLSYSLTGYFTGGISWTKWFDADPNVNAWRSSFSTRNINGWLGVGWTLDFGKVLIFRYRDAYGRCAAAAYQWQEMGGARHPLVGVGSYGGGHTEDGTEAQALSWDYGPNPKKPDLACKTPKDLWDGVNSLHHALDTATGLVKQINHSGNVVNVAYWEAADYQQIDPSAPPSAYDYRRPPPEGEAADYWGEETKAVKSVSDSFGRSSIGTTMARPLASVDKFLLTEVAAGVFGGGTGRWTLHYEAKRIDQAPPGWPDIDPDAVTTLPFLVRVELPEDASGARLTYTFSYNRWGELAEIRSPSGARTAFAWDNEWIAPDTDTYRPSDPPRRRIVVSKTVYPDPYLDPTIAHTWRYAHDRFPRREACASPSAFVKDPWRTIVTDPEGNDTEYRFFNTDPNSGSGVRVWGGLPGAVKYYKGRAKGWADGADYFSEGDAGFPGTGRLVRAHYYRYDVNPNSPQPAEIHRSGVQTVYFDDPLDALSSRPLDPNRTGSSDMACRANLEMEEFLGSAKLEGWAWHAEVHDPIYQVWNHVPGPLEGEMTEFGNLVGPERLQTIGELPEACGLQSQSAWGRKVLRGGAMVEISQRVNDPNNPALGSCVRRADPAGRSYGETDTTLYRGDVRVTASRSAGRVTGLIYSGGDPVSADPNATGESGITYRETLQYAYGALRSRKFEGVEWYSVDRTIDAASGLTAASRDTAGVETRYLYDALGRVVQVSPPAPEHPTFITYSTESRQFVDGGSTNTHTCSRAVEVRGGDLADPAHTFARYEHDGLGRLTRETRRRHDGTLAERTRAYDGLGAVSFESEWHATNLSPPHPGTTISYRDGDPAFPPQGRRDPFGRPLKITDAAGGVTEIRYFGLNEGLTLRGINDPWSPIGVTTTIYRDWRGNARLVNAPAGADALYDHDHEGRLTRVRLVPSFQPAVYDDVNSTTADLRADRLAVVIPAGAFVQTRTFTRDGLGQVRRAAEPERGTTTYHAYDPRGNVTLRQDNAGRLTRLSYGPAAETVKVEMAESLTSSFKVREEFLHADAAASAAGRGAALGKILMVTSYDQPSSWSARREFHYLGVGGRLSEEVDRYSMWPVSGAAGPAIRTRYSYDEYGRLGGLTYPVADGWVREPLALSYVYQHGWLTRLDYNKATPDPEVLTPLATVAYHPSGAVASVGFPNGVAESWSVDDQGRPRYFSVARGATTLFNSGSYLYDGPGNIVQIGNQGYHYDGIGRLTSSSTASATTPPVYYGQTYQYDLYGSMTQRSGPPLGTQTFVADPNTNRLTRVNPSGADLEVLYDAAGSVASDGAYDYLHDVEGHLHNVRLKGSGSDLERYEYDDRDWRFRKDDTARGMTTLYVRGLDGRVLTEFARPVGASSEPRWKKDYVYALGRHVAAVENAESPAPGGVTSSASEPGTSPWVSLSWAAPAADVYGYHVYRSESGAAGPYTRLDEAPLQGRTYLDGIGLTGGAAYHYKLTSLNNAGLESPGTPPRKITPGDATPPEPVPHVEGLGDMTPLFILWEPAPDTEGDLAGYRVYRRRLIDPAEAMVQVSGLLPQDRSMYADGTALQGKTYVYQVRSVDTAGNESENNLDVEVYYWYQSGGAGLVLPSCKPGIDGVWSGEEDGVCLPGEIQDVLADHVGGGQDWRVIFYHVDHLGTPRVITDEFGTVVSQHAFFPFGEEVPGPWPAAESTNTHWFTGHERDAGIDLDYLLARNYCPRQGRFSSPDPLTLALIQGGISSSYAYVANSPLIWTDPTGMQRDSTLAFCVAAALSGSVAVVGGTLTAVFAVAPEPVITKAAAMQLAGYSVALGSLAIDTGSKCLVGRAEEVVVARCLESQTDQACRQAATVCYSALRHGGEPPEGCDKVMRILREKSESRCSRLAGRPCPNQDGTNDPLLPALVLQP